MWIPRAEINNSDTYRCKGNRDLYLKSTTLYTLLFAFTLVFPPHVSCPGPKEGEWGSWNGRQEVKSSTRESNEKQRVWHVSRDARKSSLAWEMHALAEARPKKKCFPTQDELRIFVPEMGSAQPSNKYRESIKSPRFERWRQAIRGTT